MNLYFINLFFSSGLNDEFHPGEISSLGAEITLHLHDGSSDAEKLVVELSPFSNIPKKYENPGGQSHMDVTVVLVVPLGVKKCGFSSIS